MTRNVHGLAKKMVRSTSSLRLSQISYISCVRFRSLFGLIQRPGKDTFHSILCVDIDIPMATIYSYTIYIFFHNVAEKRAILVKG